MAWPAVKRAFTQEEFRRYVETVRWANWRPSFIIWHNTAEPTLARWMKSAEQDRARSLFPGQTRINNLETYFRNNNGWTGCPHLFIANDYIWVMNPLNAKGVHSPSYNSTSIGIEMIGDFDSEDDDSGEGLRVKRNTIFATAVLCDALGIDPRTHILLHKEDKRTTHDCPGKNIAKDKGAMVASVFDLMSGGEHDPQASAKIIAGEVPEDKPVREGVTIVDDLNFRRGPGVENESTGSLPRGTKLTILDAAGSWLKVKTPAGHIGWVSGRYVQTEEKQK